VRRDRPAGAPLIVVHAPSDPQVKGTGGIEAAVREAARHAPLELRVLHGLPHSAVLDALREADLAVDQLNSVTTGIFALEAMHAGLPVLSELDAKAIAPFQSAAPIVPVTAGSLADALRALAMDEPRRQRLAAAGPPYVRRLHLAPAAARAALLVYEHSRLGPAGLFEATADGVVALAGEERELRAAFAAATAS
jgi:glycosyltransferase involved in cell wall biosynthesis